jgi:hypothetical protein
MTPGSSTPLALLSSLPTKTKVCQFVLTVAPSAAPYAACCLGLNETVSLCGGGLSSKIPQGVCLVEGLAIAHFYAFSFPYRGVGNASLVCCVVRVFLPSHVYSFPGRLHLHNHNVAVGLSCLSLACSEHFPGDQIGALTHLFRLVSAPLEGKLVVAPARLLRESVKHVAAGAELDEIIPVLDSIARAAARASSSCSSHAVSPILVFWLHT